MTEGDENLPNNIRIELSSENDLFFYFLTEIDILTFKKLQETQNLKCNFSEFLPTLKKLYSLANSAEDERIKAFNQNLKNNKASNCINSNPIVIENNISDNKNNDNYKLQLNINSEDINYSTFDVIRVLSHKEISVLSLRMFQVNSEFLKKIISYKINYNRSLIAIIEDRINVINELVEEKNPNLFDQIRKEPCKLTEDFIKSKTKSNFYKFNTSMMKKTICDYSAIYNQ